MLLPLISFKLFITIITIKMSAFSIYIPHVFPNFDKDYIVDKMSIAGTVSSVDLVAKIGKDDKSYNAAYVHFSSCDSGFKRMVEAAGEGGDEVQVPYDGPWYWIILPNKAKKHIPGDRKPRIDLGNATSLSASNFPILENPKLTRSERIDIPAASTKSYAQALNLDENATSLSASIFPILEKPRLTRSERVDLPATTESYAQALDIFNIPYTETLDNEFEMAALSKIGLGIPDAFDEDDEVEQMYAEMDEIDAEIEAENANLVSIDGRYVQALEVENLWLRNEMAQLRASVLNLDYLYQVEAAKVRALNIPHINIIPNDENV